MSSNRHILTALLLGSTLFTTNIAQSVPLDVPGGGAACAGTCITEGVDFSGDGTLTVANNINIGATSGVSATNSIGVNEQGAIDFAGNSTVAGSLGTPSATLKQIDLNGAGTTVTLNGDTAVGGLNFGADGILEISPSVNLSVTNGVTATNNLEGKLVFKGSSNVIGDLGAGNLTEVRLNGPGTVTLNNDVNTSLALVVEGGGTIEHFGKITTGSVAINTTGTLRPNTSTTITVLNVINGGNFDLGRQMVTLPAGGYEQTATGRLGIEVMSESLFGRIDVRNNGAIINAGGSVDVRFSGSVADGTTLRIIDGTGNPDLINVPSLTGDTATYNLSLATENGVAPGDSLFLTINRTPLPVSTSFNTALAGISSTLENTTSQSALYPIKVLLESQATTQNLENTLLMLLPISDDSIMTPPKEHMTQAIGLVRHRIDQLRQAPSAGYNSGDETHDHATWIQFFGSDINQDKRDGIPGYDAWDVGFGIGYDYQLDDTFLAGVGLSVANTDVVSKFFTRNKLDIQSYQAFVYGSWVPMEPWYVDGFLSAAYHYYHSLRNILIPPAGAVPGVNNSAYSDFGAWQFLGWVESGYDWHYRDFLITPHVNLRYSNFNVDTVEEKGAGALNLTVKYEDINELLLGAGLRIGYLSKMRHGVTVHPHLFGQVFHDFVNDRVQTSTRFFGGGGSFVTQGMKPDDTTFRVGAGVDMACLDNWLLTVNYDYEFRNDYYSHGGYLKFRKEWL